MSNEKIIIVDDEPDVLDLCKRILDVKGYQIKTAHSGQEVIDLAQQEHFDLLLTDIRMPGMSGLEVAQAVKQFSPYIICVTMTGFSTMDMAIEALKLGVDEFVLKPFSPQELSATVAKALEKERLRKENFRLRSLIPLFELNKTLMGTVEVEELLQHLLSIAQAETKADLARIYTIEQGNLVSHLTAAQEAVTTPEQQQASSQLAQLSLTTNRQVNLNLQNASLEQINILEKLNAQDVIITPLKSKEAILGILVLGRSDSSFAPSDNDFLSVLVSQAGIALENAKLFAEIQGAYQELKKLDHMKSEFINIAAHELRTPLAILMGYANMLEEDLEGTQKDYVEMITRNALRLSSLIDDMLHLQSLEYGTISLSQDPVNLSAVVQATINDLALWVEEKNLNIQLDIPADFPQMVLDRQKFDLIIINLFNNAIKFTPARGQITFSAKVSGNYALMAIQNTGISIPQDKLERVFDRFYQVESSLTREHGGIGLGLAIVKGMVEVCGGEIRAESEEGVSTTFVFTLPLDNREFKSRKPNP